MAILALSSLVNTSFAGSPCGVVQQFTHHSHIVHHQPFANIVYPVPAFAKFVAVEADPYNVQLVGSTLRYERKAKAAAETASSLVAEVQSLRGELAALRAAIAGDGVPATPAKPAKPQPSPPPPAKPADPPANQPENPTPAPQPAPEDTADPTIRPAADDLTDWVWNMFSTRCANCHSGSTAKGNFVLFQDDKVTKVPLTVSKLELIDQVLYSNEMPKAPVPKLNAQEYDQFRSWMQLQTKAIREVARSAIKK